MSYPVHLLVAGKRCLVVGGGTVALRRTAGLVAAGGEVTVIAPELRGPLPVGATHVAETYDPASVPWSEIALLIAATNDPAVNTAAVSDARRNGVPAGRVDSAWRDGDFSTPAAVRAGGLVVTASAAGEDHARAAMIRRMLTRWADNWVACELFYLALPAKEGVDPTTALAALSPLAVVLDAAGYRGTDVVHLTMIATDSEPALHAVRYVLAPLAATPTMNGPARAAAAWTTLVELSTAEGGTWRTLAGNDSTEETILGRLLAGAGRGETEAYDAFRAQVEHWRSR